MRGKTCVITGATSGIGKATAFALAAMGASLVTVGRNADRGALIRRELLVRHPHAQVDFYPADWANVGPNAVATQNRKTLCGESL
jgi:short-subunit dehydrogenase